MLNPATILRAGTMDKKKAIYREFDRNYNEECFYGNAKWFYPSYDKLITMGLKYVYHYSNPYRSHKHDYSTFNFDDDRYRYSAEYSWEYYWNE